MLVACELAGDLERAAQWCRVADEFIRQLRLPVPVRPLPDHLRRRAGGERAVGAGRGRARCRHPHDRRRRARLAGRRTGPARRPAPAPGAPRRGRGAAARCGGEARPRAGRRPRLRLARGEPSVAVGLLERAPGDGQPGITASGTADRGRPGDAGRGPARPATPAPPPPRRPAGRPGRAAGDSHGGGQVAALAAPAEGRVTAAEGGPERGRAAARAGAGACSPASTSRWRPHGRGSTWPGCWPRASPARGRRGQERPWRRSSGWAPGPTPMPPPRCCAPSASARQNRAQGGRRADQTRTGGASPGRPRPLEPRDRRAPVHQPQDGRSPRQQRAREAGVRNRAEAVAYAPGTRTPASCKARGGWCSG